MLWIYILFLKKNFQIQIRNKEARYLDKLVWLEWMDGYNTTSARDQDTPTPHSEPMVFLIGRLLAIKDKDLIICT